MNFLDLRTVFFSQVATDVIFSWVIILLWLNYRKRFSGTFFWVVNSGFQTAGVLLILLRGIIPDWASIVIGNTLVFAGALLGYMGLERFVGKKSRQVHNYILLAAFPLVLAYFAFVQPNLAARNLTVSTGILVLFFQCIWLLFRRVSPDMRRITRGLGFVFVFFCLMGIMRIISILVSPQPENDFYKSGDFDIFILLSCQFLLILLVYNLTLMFNRRLLMEIQSQEEKFSKAFRSSPYALMLTRLSDGRIMEVNDNFGSTTGYQPSEVIGKTTIELHLWVREEDRSIMVKTLSEEGRMPGREFPFRTKSGELLTGLISAEIILINQEPFILASINDITDRKLDEEAIRESEERYRQVVENANEAILVAQDGIIKFHNPKTEELIGYSAEELPNKPFVEFIHPEDRGLVLERYQKRLAGEVLPQVYPFRIITKQGQIKWVEINAITLSWNGRPATLNFLSDITERKAMEDQLQRLSVMDDLTGLYNRRGFLTLAGQQLKVAERTQQKIILFFADLDNMKWINDTLGHQLGDQALINTAAVLKESFRESDIIGRMGGDEFAVLALDTEDMNPDLLLLRLKNFLKDYNRKGTSPFRLDLSVGRASYDPQNPSPLDQLLAEADRLMYAQKRNKNLLPL